MSFDHGSSCMRVCVWVCYVAHRIPQWIDGMGMGMITILKRTQEENGHGMWEARKFIEDIVSWTVTNWRYRGWKITFECASTTPNERNSFQIIKWTDGMKQMEWMKEWKKIGRMLYFFWFNSNHFILLWLWWVFLHLSVQSIFRVRRRHFHKHSFASKWILWQLRVFSIFTWFRGAVCVCVCEWCGRISFVIVERANEMTKLLRMAWN